MKSFSLRAGLAAAAAFFALVSAATEPRPMENLGRGVVAVRANETHVLVSWRLLGLDPDDIGFNVYRATGDGSSKRINSDVLTKGTNFLDSEADLDDSNTYQVRSVVDGKESKASSKFTLPSSNTEEPAVRIPIKAGGQIKFVWVGDLDGDGEYDYVLDRQTSPQTLEAYRSDGTFLWEINMGPNSEDQDNIEPSSATIDVGHWDGVTVYDFDSDGYAEVAVRIANGVTFGDGETFDKGSDDNIQYVAILDGKTGALRSAAQIPDDYLSDGPMGARFGVGYLDAAWTFDGSDVTMEWKWLRGDQDAPDGHNTRIIDVNGDGKGEVAEIGFMLNGDGSVRYLLGPEGIIHGDRFHIAKMDPSRDGLQGYGVQQRNPSKLYEYYYDATDGTLLWEHFGDNVTDIGRGMVGDIDPRYDGMEVWSFSGISNAPSDELTESDTELAPWPHLGIWWDGDELLELFNDGRIEKWDWENPTSSNDIPRLLKDSDYSAITPSGRYPAFIGDIFGDWREEVILTNADYSELIIFTTDIPSDIRLYTLPHNPAYRNAMTLKGYMQSHHVDYFLGEGMKKPPKPNIRYAGI
ncbi:hypothetical protein AK830_g9853 [Neonectria ditissima]|uniref:Uncharacterized protein n=1 Tax=Neonectria ditissima TaxID=78410 RepID=A0A0P7AH41_9HYPO|nr:hypothetical protein AK830_g9853 [Neonectria ditissima]